MISAVAGKHLLASWNDHLLTFMLNNAHEKKKFFTRSKDY